MTVANSMVKKSSGQGHAQFNCQYLINGDR